jgi:hypothetical protein
MPVRDDAQGAATDGVTRPAYEDERGQFIEEGRERVDGVWPVPEEGQADTPVIVDLVSL